MKKLFFLLAFSISLYTTHAFAQSTEKTDTKKSETKKEKTKKEDTAETTAERHDRHKEFWKKVGNDQKEFWKDEHERHVKNKEAKDGKKIDTKSDDAAPRENSVEKKERKEPPKPPNPFKKKKKKEAEKEEAASDSGSN